MAEVNTLRGTQYMTGKPVSLSTFLWLRNSPDLAVAILHSAQHSVQIYFPYQICLPANSSGALQDEEMKSETNVSFTLFKEGAKQNLFAFGSLPTRPLTLHCTLHIDCQADHSKHCTVADFPAYL